MNNLRGRFLCQANNYTMLPQNCTKFPKPFLQYSTVKSSRVRKSSEMFKEKMRRMRREQSERIPCYLTPRRSEYKCLAYQELIPDSCKPQQCLPIDLKSYQPTDKDQRKYQKTWCEFKPLPSASRKPKIRKIYPKRERRNTKAFRGKLCTACEPEDCELPLSDRAPPPKLFPPKTMPWPCCKLRSVTCRSMRDGKCDPGRLPLCCVKRKTPYLSFSECKKFELQPPIAACECDTKPSLCDLWNFWRTKR